MKTNSHLELVAFVLEQAQGVPPAKQARLYRALSEIVGLPEEAKRLREMASLLEEADGHFRQFMFSFSQKISA